MIFQNRAQAGEKLGAELLSLELRDPFVLAVPRGGVPVGKAVAAALACPLDVISLIKIPVPWMPEASYGAAAVDGTLALNMPLVHRLELSEREIEMASEPVIREAQRREDIYRRGRDFPSLEQKSVVIVDDGLGSGYSMLAAVDFVRKRNPRMVVAAAPVASNGAFRMLAALPRVNLLIVLIRDPDQIFSLNSHYRDLSALEDDDVIRSLSFPA